MRLVQVLVDYKIKGNDWVEAKGYKRLQELSEVQAQLPLKVFQG
jgi:hypothetical protein